jgi:hypothetical protein
VSINISQATRKKMPEGERKNLDQALWDKSGGRCFLCEEPLNRAADDIQADHDLPESDGGTTEIANLNLAHASCNKAKRNAKTVPIRPYLRLTSYAKRKGGRIKYDGFLEHFDISPKPSVVSVNGATATFELPNGSTVNVPVFEETNTTGTHRNVFLNLPQEAIFNDDDCQPRVVRTDHVWSIYADMQRNVLHEPPSCRLESLAPGKPVRLLLFDGQHKTLASWMMGRTSITSKVYLDMTTAQANELVNSIQAKIKKLPLSPFELAGKMADEWQNKFTEFEEEVGTSEVSEAGFLAWLPQTERARGKAALQSALVQNVLSSADLRITAHVKRPGATSGLFSFTEQTLKAKIIERLVAKDAQTTKGVAAQTGRDVEASNVVALLNVLNDYAFEPSDDGAALTSVETERARRMCYQGSLSYVADLVRRMYERVVITATTKSPMSTALTEDQGAELSRAIKLIVDHPVWTADFDRDARMKSVKTSLEKNQETVEAFEGVGLDLSYLVMGKEATPYKTYWT